jgi:hypothetical protein
MLMEIKFNNNNNKQQTHKYQKNSKKKKFKHKFKKKKKKFKKKKKIFEEKSWKEKKPEDFAHKHNQPEIENTIDPANDKLQCSCSFSNSHSSSHTSAGLGIKTIHPSNPFTTSSLITPSIVNSCGLAVKSVMNH